MSGALQATSPSLARARASSRSPVGALTDTLRDPTAWLLGCAGFLARGGIVVAALGIWAIPSPAGISLLIPPTAISTSGVSAGFAVFLAGLGLGLGVLALGAATVAAVVDTHSFRLMVGIVATPSGTVGIVATPSGAAGIVATPSGAASIVAPPPGTAGVVAAPARRGPPRRSRPAVVAGLVLLEVVALLPALVAAGVAARRLLEVGRQEYLVPSSLAVPFVVRVVERARPEVAALAGCLLLADLAYALGSRWWLRRSLLRPAEAPVASVAPTAERRSPQAGTPAIAARVGRRLRRAAALGSAWALGWAATLAVVGAGLLAVTQARATLERVVLQPSAGAGPGAILAFVGAVALLVGTWALALVLAGGVSVCRAALWTWLLAPGPP